MACKHCGSEKTNCDVCVRCQLDLNQQAEIRRLEQWVDDLQSGMYINCVYCGWRAGTQEEGVPADILKAHIMECPEHPLSIAIAALREAYEECHRYGGNGAALITIRVAFEKLGVEVPG